MSGQIFSIHDRYGKAGISAECYVDNQESYSTNEITIYWNSLLTYLLTFANDEKTSYNRTKK